MSSCGETNHQWKKIRYTRLTTISSSTIARNRRLRVSGIRRIVATSLLLLLLALGLVGFGRFVGGHDALEFHGDVEAILLGARILLDGTLRRWIGDQFGFAEQSYQLRCIVTEALQFDFVFFVDVQSLEV